MKEFLECSTIHGLYYIAGNRQLVRLLWICVVIAGFTGSFILIHQSFSSWSDSPISTTIETLPISELEFPNVTVCPPKNSFTSLNPDLVMARNINFDEEKRTSLSDSVVQALYDASFNSKYKEFIDYRQDQYIDWYTGISSVRDLPRELENPMQKQYILKTTAINGIFSTPYFRQSLDEHMFEFDIENIVYIYVPANMSINNSLIIDIDMDISEKMEMDISEAWADHIFIYIHIENSSKNSGEYLGWDDGEYLSVEHVTQNEKKFQRYYKIGKFYAFENRYILDIEYQYSLRQSFSGLDCQ